jgi:perosamine synthetase
MKWIPYGRQEITDADIAAVVSALKSDNLTQGPQVAAFENALALEVGSTFAVAFDSGTAALHAAYHAAGVAQGQTVLTSPITFVATANAALYMGGGVRFADVTADDALIDTDSVAKALTSDVKVVVPVHLGGQVAPLETLSRLALENGSVLIEDAAHALGAVYRSSNGIEHRIGSCAHSAMCCFSFHPVKHITTGEGGAVTTNNKSFYRKLLRFRSHGITRDRSELGQDDGEWYYEQQELGFNYRITDFQCALGISQLARLKTIVARRRELAAKYDCAFRDVPSIRPLVVPANSVGSYHLYIVRVPEKERARVFKALRTDGIGVNVHYIPVPRQPYYRRLGFDPASCPNAERYYAEAITLPLFPGLKDSDVLRIAELLQKHLS